MGTAACGLRANARRKGTQAPPLPPSASQLQVPPPSAFSHQPCWVLIRLIPPPFRRPSTTVTAFDKTHQPSPALAVDATTRSSHDDRPRPFRPADADFRTAQATDWGGSKGFQHPPRPTSSTPDHRTTKGPAGDVEGRPRPLDSQHTTHHIGSRRRRPPSSSRLGWPSRPSGHKHGSRGSLAANKGQADELHPHFPCWCLPAHCAQPRPLTRPVARLSPVPRPPLAPPFLARPCRRRSTDPSPLASLPIDEDPVAFPSAVRPAPRCEILTHSGCMAGLT